MFLGVNMKEMKKKFFAYGEFEGYKKTRSRANEGTVLNCLKRVFVRWQRRWIVIGQNQVWYYRPKQGNPTLLRDSCNIDNHSNFKVDLITKRKVEFCLHLTRRTIRLRVKGLINGLSAVHSILELFRNSDYCKIHRNISFAPVRQHNNFDFFIDGKDYFSSVHQAISSATEEIFITGWMISPEVPLIRPDANQISTSGIKDPVTLADTLYAAAQRGISIHVLVYKEVAMASYNDSDHVKTTFEKLHPRIKVIRHPPEIGFWSHHEKMVVVDRKIAFIGGLDLTWGRWDSDDHLLLSPDNTPELFPGIDYYNPLIKDIIRGRDYENSMIRRNIDPRMPWHDVAVKLRGPVVHDFVSHFIIYWNYARNYDDLVYFPLFEEVIAMDDMGQPKPSNLKQEESDLSSLLPSPHHLHHLNNFENYAKMAQFQHESSLNDEVTDDLIDEYDMDQEDDNDMEMEIDRGFQYNRKGSDIAHDNRLVELDRIELKNEMDEDQQADRSPTRKFLQSKEAQVFRKLDFLYKWPNHKFSIPREDPEACSRPPLARVAKAKLITGIANQPLVSPRALLTDKVGNNNDQHLESVSKEGFKKHSLFRRDGRPKTEQENIEAGLNKDGIFQPQNPPDQYVVESGELKATLKPIYDVRSLAHIKIEVHEAEVSQQFNTNTELKPLLEPINGKSELKLESLLIPLNASDQKPEENLRSGIRKRSNAPKRSLIINGKEVQAPLRNFKMQALRSANYWSIGLPIKETSIQSSYIESIINAKRFIYIENQFFISSIKDNANNPKKVRNRVIKAILYRIKKAIDCNEKFKVYVFVPLMPAFEAKLEKQQGLVMQAQIGLQNRTIGKDSQSLLGRIKELTSTPEEYIMFCSLRRYQMRSAQVDVKGVDGNDTDRVEPTVPVTNMIYIHSKVDWWLLSCS